MNKAILISIRPEHLLNILNGTKTLELRKSVPKDYKGWVYIYCTKGRKDILHKHKDKYYTNHYLTFTDSAEVLNSKVVARFWFDEIEYVAEFSARELLINALNRLCITENEFKNYLKGKYGYAWCIKKLEIFDEPLMLSDFYTRESLLCDVYAKESFLYDDYDDGFNYCLQSTEIKKAPQSWQYIYTKRSC